ncbi:MAG: CvpA family protein [Gammaproteobacteria bacterium]|nr:CvpA family protein [Gammaproteobacteria bacterium]MBT8111475.1 CvpA family protein [Gammaproteobacteria bacterium]NND46644.1 CvpA family protein [Woeseiaceae bacterium]NNL46173.1 CvpA family protein [Woeseiaceae bacterium]
MPIIDIIITVAIVVSIVVGFVRGFVKEAISIAALLIAIWAALYFGPAVGNVSDSWLSSEELQMWFGRILVFAVILSIGGLLGWGISKLVRLSVLSGMDRLMGSLFGAGRGILLMALFIIGGQFAGFNNDGWWLKSRLIPHFEIVADWIKVMAPKGFELLMPDEEAETLPIDVPEVLVNPT